MEGFSCGQSKPSSKESLEEAKRLNLNCSFSQIGAAYQMSSVAIYVVDLKRVEPLGSSSRNGTDARLNARNVSAGNRTNVRRSFAKGMAGNPRYAVCGRRIVIFNLQNISLGCNLQACFDHF